MYARLFKTVGAKNRTRFVQANLACIECVYAQACNRDVRTPMILLLDLRDRDGVTLARSCFPDEQEVRDFIKDCAKERSVPTAIVAVSPECAKQKIASTFPDLWREFSQSTRRTCFHVGAVAFGEQVHWTHQPPAVDDCCCR